MLLLFVYTSKIFCTSYTPLYFTKSILIIIGFAKLLLWFCSFQITRCKTLQATLMFKQTSDIDNDGGEKLDNDDDDDDDDPYLFRSS